MKKKLKAAVSDPLFVRLCVLFALMIALGALAAVMYGKERFRYVLQAAYAAYVPLLFFTLKYIFTLYRRYFREKKPKKESALRKKIRQLFRRAEEKIRAVFDMKPKLAYFGGEDESVDAAPDGERTARKKRADTRVSWASLRKNTEKIRFLYAARINEEMKAGKDVAPSDTARQALTKIRRDERDDMLFDLYESVRYTDHAEPVTDGTVGYLAPGAAPVKAAKGKKK